MIRQAVCLVGASPGYLVRCSEPSKPDVDRSALIGRCHMRRPPEGRVESAAAPSMRRPRPTEPPKGRSEPVRGAPMRAAAEIGWRSIPRRQQRVGEQANWRTPRALPSGRPEAADHQRDTNCVCIGAASVADSIMQHRPSRHRGPSSRCAAAVNVNRDPPRIARSI